MCSILTVVIVAGDHIHVVALCSFDIMHDVVIDVVVDAVVDVVFVRVLMLKGKQAASYTLYSLDFLPFTLKSPPTQTSVAEITTQ